MQSKRFSVASSVAMSSDVIFANHKILSILSLIYDRLFDGKPIIEPKSDYLVIFWRKIFEILPNLRGFNCKWSNISRLMSQNVFNFKAKSVFYVKI
jgi:hypothetical protein